MVGPNNEALYFRDFELNNEFFEDLLTLTGPMCLFLGTPLEKLNFHQFFKIKLEK